jgi:hypothetical protein
MPVPANVLTRDNTHLSEAKNTRVEHPDNLSNEARQTVSE